MSLKVSSGSLGTFSGRVYSVGSKESWERDEVGRCG